MSNLRQTLPPLGALAAFEAAARLGSFTRAAEELNLTQAAISRQIRLLEENLGQPLFARRRHDVALTEAGQSFAAAVAPALRSLSASAETLRQSATAPDELTIFCDLGMTTGLLTTQIGGFGLAYPQINLRIISSDQPPESADTPFDLALQSGHWAVERFEVSPLAEDEILVVCAPALRERLPAKPAIEDLASQTLLHLQQPSRPWEGWPTLFQHFGLSKDNAKALGHELARGPTFSNYRSVLDSAREGIGLAIGWRLTTAESIKRGELVEVEGFRMPTSHHLNAYIPRGRPANPAARSFIAWFKQTLSAV